VQPGNGSQFQLFGGLAAGLPSGSYDRGTAMVRSDDGLLFVSTESGNGSRALITLSNAGTVTPLVGSNSAGRCSTTMPPLVATPGGYVWGAENPDDSDFCRYDASTGHVWTRFNSDIPPGTTLNYAVLDGNRIYLSYAGDSSSNWIQGIESIGTDGSNPTNYPLPQFQFVSGLTVGPDGNVWFSAYGSQNSASTPGAIGEIQGNTVVYKQSNMAISPLFLVEDDGMPYFAYKSGSQAGIGALEANGTLLQWALPASEQNCACIALESLIKGPYDNLWFQSPGGIQDFSLSTHAYGPQIAVPLLTGVYPLLLGSANDGNLWIVGPTQQSSLSAAVLLARSMTVTPLSVSLSASSPSTSVGVSERDFRGTFYARSADTSVATVSPASQAGAKQPVTFAISRSGSGTTTVWISDGPSNSSNNRVAVSVTSR
ncbi:MAG: hypothetical protein JO199_02130, partial [Candidatus Eremiobacteraeota bacterium]|nr:hypothetical protein [Candidatus Eremiobacteraeota bacterium]